MTRKPTTRQRLIESACRIFARKGYRDTTIAEISADAGANIAAVNYHFGGKEKLYEAVWRHALESTRNAYGEEKGGRRTPEEWLRGHVYARVMSIFDEGPAGFFPRIMHREMANPSAVTERLREKYLAPQIRRMEQNVRKMLGPSATKWQVQFCCTNIHGAYVLVNVMRRARKGPFDTGALTQKAAERLARQTVEFIVAGVKGVRAQMEKGRLA